MNEGKDYEGMIVRHFSHQVNYGNYVNKWEIRMPNAVTEKITSKVFLVGNYMFKVNYRNTRTRCEIFHTLF